MGEFESGYPALGPNEAKEARDTATFWMLGDELSQRLIGSELTLHQPNIEWRVSHR